MVNYRFEGKFLTFCRDIFIEPGEQWLRQHWQCSRAKCCLNCSKSGKGAHPIPLHKARVSPVSSLPLSPRTLCIYVNFFLSAREKSTFSSHPFPQLFCSGKYTNKAWFLCLVIRGKKISVSVKSQSNCFHWIHWSFQFKEINLPNCLAEKTS